MQKTVFAIILSVLITVIILGGIFMFWQNKENSLNKEVKVQEKIEQAKENQEKEFDNEIVQVATFVDAEVTNIKKAQQTGKVENLKQGCDGITYMNVEKNLEICLPTEYEEVTSDEDHKKNITRINFGPIVEYPHLGPMPGDSSFGFAYEMLIIPNRSEGDIIDSDSLNIEQDLLDINNFQVIRLVSGGFAGSEISFEIITPNFNLILRDNGSVGVDDGVSQDVMEANFINIIESINLKK
jgi:hypothetical protein